VGRFHEDKKSAVDRLPFGVEDVAQVHLVGLDFFRFLEKSEQFLADWEGIGTAKADHPYSTLSPGRRHRDNRVGVDLPVKISFHLISGRAVVEKLEANI
jgi:hypothetical protein